MLSGYLLLDKEYDSEPAVFSFYRKNLLTLLFTTQIWIVLLNLFDVFTGNAISEVKMLKELLFLGRNKYDVMWYMPMIIGLYLFLPYVSEILKKMSAKLLWILLIISVVFNFLPYDLNYLFQIFNLDIELNSIVGMGFSGGVYGTYLIAGYLFKREYLKKFKIKWCILAGFLYFVFLVAIQLLGGYNVGYESCILLFLSLFIFYSFLNIDHIPFKAVWKIIVKMSLGIYFLQGPVLSLIETPEFTMADSVFEKMFMVCFLVMVAFIICGLISLLIYQNKILRKWLLRIK